MSFENVLLLVSHDKGIHKLLVEASKGSGVLELADDIPAVSIRIGYADSMCRVHTIVLDRRILSKGPDELIISVSAICRSCPHVRVVVVDDKPDWFEARAVLRAGASDYLSVSQLSAQAAEFVDAILRSAT